MKSFLYVFQLELRALTRDPTLAAVLSIFVCATGYSLYCGHTWHSELAHSAEQVDSREQALRTKRRQILLERERNHNDSPQGYYDPSHPGSVGILNGTNVVLPPSSWARLSVGQTDLWPQSTLVTALNAHSLSDGIDTQSPLQQLAGRFDLVFVLVVLYPLLMLALSHDLVSRERELGRLTLLLAQPTNTARLLGARGLARGFPLLVAAALVSALSIVWAQGGQYPLGSGPKAVWWVLLVIAYGLLWLAVGVVASSRATRSATSALGALGCWLVLVVALPAAYDTVIEWWVPLPSRTDHIAAKRDAIRRAETHADALLSGYLRDHPEFGAAPVAGHDDPAMGFMPRYLAIAGAVEGEIKPIQQAFDAAREKRQRIAQQLRFVSPALVLQSALCDLAGTGPSRHTHFKKARQAFQSKWRRFFLPLGFSKQRLTSADYEQMPQFKIPAEQLQNIIQHTISDFLALAALLGLVTLLATRLMAGCAGPQGRR